MHCLIAVGEIIITSWRRSVCWRLFDVTDLRVGDFGEAAEVVAAFVLKRRTKTGARRGERLYNISSC